MSEIARELGTLVGLQRESDVNRRIAVEEKIRQKEEDKVKLPSEVFGGQILNVMRLANVDNERESYR